MSIREMRLQTKLSQSKFAAMFDIPVSTLRDWEQGRRTPPAHVLKMIKTILHENGLLNDNSYIEACELRKKNVESALAVLFSATNGPDEAFMDVLQAYISGEITLEEMEANVDHLVYLGV